MLWIMFLQIRDEVLFSRQNYYTEGSGVNVFIVERKM